MNRRELLVSAAATAGISAFGCSAAGPAVPPEPVAASATERRAGAKVPSTPRRVLWAANVRNKPLAARLDTARRGGFTHMSMFPIDYRSMRSAGRTVKDIRAEIEASGITVGVCDPFVQWVPRFQVPPGYAPDYVAFVDHKEDVLYEMAEAIGATSVNCVEPFGVRYETPELVDALGAFSKRAAAHGLTARLEFMPISGIPDLATAWAVLRELPEVGFTFDTWHFHRSNPDHALLATIPPERIAEVQLADAKRELRGGSLTEDLLHHRLLPGEGELDVATTTKLLASRGALGSVGPELFSDVMDGLAAEEAGRRCGDNLTAWLAAHGH